MPQSILNRGADTILNIGAWNDSPPPPNINQLSMADNIGAIVENVVTTLTLGGRCSLISRGAYGNLNIGVFQHPDPLADLDQSLVDNLVVTESVAFTSTPTVYPHPGLMRRGSSEDTIHHRGLEIGAWQTPFPRVAGIMPFVPEVTSGFGRHGPFDFGGLQSFELLVDDITEIIPYKIQVITGHATDAFPDAFIPFDFYTKHVLITVWDNPLDVILTRHGTESFYAVVEDFGFLKRLAVRGYKIKNTTPGLVARYQIIALG